MTGTWCHVGASARGPSHERDGTACEDAWTAWCDGARLLLAVADGAGSSSLAEVGARIAVSTAAEHARTCWSSAELAAVARACVVAARTAIVAEASRRETSARELASTLIVVLAEGARVAVAQVGDGGVVGAVSETEFVMLSAPSRGEYANEATFVTSESWQSDLRVHQRDGILGICAFSDGCQRACLVAGAQPRPFDSFFEPIFEFIREISDVEAAQGELAAMLHNPQFRDHSDDDKTLVIAWSGVTAARPS